MLWFSDVNYLDQKQDLNVSIENNTLLLLIFLDNSLILSLLTSILIKISLLKVHPPLHFPPFQLSSFRCALRRTFKQNNRRRLLFMLRPRFVSSIHAPCCHSEISSVPGRGSIRLDSNLYSRFSFPNRTRRPPTARLRFLKVNNHFHTFLFPLPALLTPRQNSGQKRAKRRLHCNNVAAWYKLHRNGRASMRAQLTRDHHRLPTFPTSFCGWFDLLLLLIRGSDDRIEWANVRETLFSGSCTINLILRLLQPGRAYGTRGCV